MGVTKCPVTKCPVTKCEKPEKNLEKYHNLPGFLGVCRPAFIIMYFKFSVFPIQCKTCHVSTMMNILDFSSEPPVANENLENEPRS
jgi:hypothetical protein